MQFLGHYHKLKRASAHRHGLRSSVRIAPEGDGFQIPTRYSQSTKHNVRALRERMTEEQKITIYADEREAQTPILQRLADLNVHLKVGSLEIGDFVIAGDVVVERKTATEFVASIMSGRLFNQAGKMQLKYRRIIFMIMGDLYATGKPISKDAIEGALAWLTVVVGASVLHERNPRHSADQIYRLAKQAQDGLDQDAAFRRGKVPKGNEQSRYSIEGTLGVGPSLGLAILKHCRSTHGFVNASVEELLAIPGIGRKKAESIYESFRIEYQPEQGELGCSMFEDEPE